MSSAIMHPAFAQTDHRPWPLPNRKWLLTQTWMNLLFLHWEIDVNDLRARIPDRLDIDLHEGKAYIAIVPFDMKGVTLRNCPKVSFLSDFPEINVRTYVTCEGKPGVWFFSLDVPSRFAVWTARTFFHLPYRHGIVAVDETGPSIRYQHRVKQESFSARYRPIEKLVPTADSFETWATERYCLYCQSKRGALYRTEVQHPRWPLQTASFEVEENTLLEKFDIGPQHLSVLFSKRIDVVAYSPERIS